MGTRCGNIDPGVLIYLMTELEMDVSQVTDLLYNRSGLLGLSGISHDVRELLASDGPRASQAIEILAYWIGRELGSMAASLGGLDMLVFTGGIGEHAAPVRARVCRQASWLGVRLDERPTRAADRGSALRTVLFRFGLSLPMKSECPQGTRMRWSRYEDSSGRG